MNSNRKRYRLFFALVLLASNVAVLKAQKEVLQKVQAIPLLTNKALEKQLFAPPPPPSFQGITHTSWTRRDARRETLPRSHRRRMVIYGWDRS
jgi:hypothetical protein